MKKFKLIVIGLGLLVASQNTLWAHCQVPCGIYHDAEQFIILRENVQTIEKAMKAINEISEQETPDYHKLARWTVTKEQHAAKIQFIVQDYFLAQRVSPITKDMMVVAVIPSPRDVYKDKLMLLHQIIVAAMKAKQTTDLAYVKQLNKLIHDFEHLYNGKK